MTEYDFKPLIMSKVSPEIQELIDALLERAMPTRTQIRMAIELAYQAGKCEGGIEACDKMLKPLKGSK